MRDYVPQVPDALERACLGLRIAIDACAGLLCEENEAALGSLDDSDIEGCVFMLQYAVSIFESLAPPPSHQVRKAFDAECPSAQELASFILSRCENR
jgi:hypothetical protein